MRKVVSEQVSNEQAHAVCFRILLGSSRYSVLKVQLADTNICTVRPTRGRV